MLGPPAAAPGAFTQGPLAVAQQQPGMALLPDEDACPLVFDIESDEEELQSNLPTGDAELTLACFGNCKLPDNHSVSCNLLCFCGDQLQYSQSLQLYIGVSSRVQMVSCGPVLGL